MKLQIAVNKNCKNKNNPTIAAGFLNITEDIEWLKGWVTAGYAWCATHFVDRYRNADNARGSNIIVVDIDGDTTLEAFWKTNTAQSWCAATYTSASHTTKEHRFRALFPLEIPLERTAQHKGAYWLVVDRLLADLGLDKLKDNCGQKPERLWYGNTNAVFTFNKKGIVPSFLLNDIDYEEPSDYVSHGITDIDIQRCSWLLREFLLPTEDGEYEDRYVPIMAACAGIGEVVFDDWVDWVLRGHHGQKKENTKRFKWKGLGNYAGHTTLYSFAKKQDANWTSYLPVELRFQSLKTAVGYGDDEPSPSFEALAKDLPTMTQNDNDNSPEPLPDTSPPKTKAKNRPKGTDALAQERQNDVRKIREILPTLQKNLLTKKIEYTDDNGQLKTIEGNDLDLMTTQISCDHGVFIAEQRMKVAIQVVARENEYCPINQYLDKCEKSAIPHADWSRVGEVFLGNTNPLATLALQRMMIGAVARARNPGCSMSWLPILVGAQGIGKSQFSRSLVPQNLFAEITDSIDLLIKEKFRLHVAWLLELPEIDHCFKPSNIENFKNIVTTRCDETRRPYAPMPESMQRRFVMIGTTNRNQFLVDSTGNRRFVPLEIGNNFLIPWQRIALERDHLWASAIEAYNRGDRYEYTSGEIADIAEYIQEFGDPDPWLDKVTSYVSIRKEVSPSQLLTEALDIDPRQQSRRETRRVTDVLQSMGWRRQITSRKDPITGRQKSVRLWLRPANDPLDEDHIAKDF